MGGQTRSRRYLEQRARERSKPGVRPRASDGVAEGLLATALSEILDEMQRNGGDIEAAIMLHPGPAAEIRPLLEIAAMLRPAKA